MTGGTRCSGDSPAAQISPPDELICVFNQTIICGFCDKKVQYDVHKKVPAPTLISMSLVTACTVAEQSRYVSMKRSIVNIGWPHGAQSAKATLSGVTIAI